jgi:hypothetical protein
LMRIHFMSALVGIHVSTKHGIQPTNELNFALQYIVDRELLKKKITITWNSFCNSFHQQCTGRSLESSSGTN